MLTTRHGDDRARCWIGSPAPSPDPHAGRTVKMSLTPAASGGDVPSIGEDTTNILAKMLGLAAPDIQAAAEVQ